MSFFDLNITRGLYRARLAAGWTTFVLVWLIISLTTSPTSFAKTLHIIHTNDLHGRLIKEKDTAGVARIARFIQDTKAETELVTHARCRRCHLWDACLEYFFGRTHL